MSGDMEQTGEAQVSYRLDDKEQEEFIQWFGRSFLRRKRDAQLAGMNFRTRPVLCNISKKEDGIQIPLPSFLTDRYSYSGTWSSAASSF